MPADQDCIFCKIISGEIPAKVIKENDFVIVIADRAPKAPVHYLIIPKKHLASVHDITEHDREIAWQIMHMARELARELPGAGAFNLISNNGAEAGQSVFHMHWHFLAGKDLWRGEL